MKKKGEQVYDLAETLTFLPRNFHLASPPFMLHFINFALYSWGRKCAHTHTHQRLWKKLKVLYSTFVKKQVCWPQQMAEPATFWLKMHTCFLKNQRRCQMSRWRVTYWWAVERREGWVFLLCLSTPTLSLLAQPHTSQITSARMVSIIRFSDSARKRACRPVCV